GSLLTLLLQKARRVREVRIMTSDGTDEMQLFSRRSSVRPSNRAQGGGSTRWLFCRSRQPLIVPKLDGRVLSWLYLMRSSLSSVSSSSEGRALSRLYSTLSFCSRCSLPMDAGSEVRKLCRRLRV